MFERSKKSLSEYIIKTRNTSSEDVQNHKRTKYKLYTQHNNEKIKQLFNSNNFLTKKHLQNTGLVVESPDRNITSKEEILPRPENEKKVLVKNIHQIVHCSCSDPSGCGSVEFVLVDWVAKI
jgi:arginine utilization protein RocB